MLRYVREIVYPMILLYIIIFSTENSSETSGDGSVSPAASPLSTQNITLATQIQETKV